MVVHRAASFVFGKSQRGGASCRENPGGWSAKPSARGLYFRDESAIGLPTSIGVSGSDIFDQRGGAANSALATSLLQFRSSRQAVSLAGEVFWQRKIVYLLSGTPTKPLILLRPKSMRATVCVRKLPIGFLTPGESDKPDRHAGLSLPSPLRMHLQTCASSPGAAVRISSGKSDPGRGEDKMEVLSPGMRRVSLGIVGGCDPSSGRVICAWRPPGTCYHRKNWRRNTNAD